MWGLDRKEWREFGRRVWTSRSRITAQSARLSFFLIFSLFPFLLFLTALVGLLLQTQTAVREFVQDHLYAVAPQSVVSLLDTVLKDVTERPKAGKLSLGLLFALWAASSGMRALMEALNMAYGVEEARVWWKQRLVALGLTGGFLSLSLLALAALLYRPRVSDVVVEWLALGQAGRIVWEIGRWGLMFLFLMVAFNVLYLFGPNVKHRNWRWLMPGTLAAGLLWIGVSLGLKLYFGFSNRYSATYGSIGGVMILLMWLYLSSVSIILGGELNSAVEQRKGKLQAKNNPQRE